MSLEFVKHGHTQLKLPDTKKKKVPNQSVY